MAINIRDGAIRDVRARMQLIRDWRMKYVALGIDCGCGYAGG